MTILSVLWYVLIFVLIAGYFVLDGFDLGSGALYPFVAKNDKERSMVRASIGPVWDGNEVWLLTAGGALFAAFAPAYATTFSGFYLAIMLVLFSLIVRAVSLEYRHHDESWGKLWDFLFFIGSFLPALLFGVAAGNVIAGIPLDANGDYIGIPLLGLITPFTLLCGVLGLAVFLGQGATWISLKAPKESDLRARAAKLRVPVQVVALVVFVLTTIYALVFVQPELFPATSFLPYLFAALFVVCLIAAMWAGVKGCDIGAFIMNSAAAVMLVFVWAFTTFPNLVIATVGENITIASAASSTLALAWMTGITCVGLPLVLAYHIIIYRTFRGRMSEDEEY